MRTAPNHPSPTRTPRTPDPSVLSPVALQYVPERRRPSTDRAQAFSHAKLSLGVFGVPARARLSRHRDQPPVGRPLALAGPQQACYDYLQLGRDEMNSALCRTLDDVVESLREKTTRATILVGAGASVTAGIPTASGFVDLIRSRFPTAYDRAPDKTYATCMAELAPGQRRNLIAEFVDKSRLNWSHIALAQLVKHGFIDRVLTTNFDPLIIRGMALVRVFPAVYDFAASQQFKPGDIPEQAVFYLHGQRTGFALLNTAAECREQAKLVTPVFREAGESRVWIVIGYSGQSDPVFEQLAKIRRFDYNLYWVTFKHEEPGTHVMRDLLSDKRYAFAVQGYDADGFLVGLAERLQCFPPEVVAKPFSYAKDLLEGIAPLRLVDTVTALDVTENARLLLDDAVCQYETPGGPRPRSAEKIAGLKAAHSLLSSLLGGSYDRVIAEGEAVDAAIAPEARVVVALAYRAAGEQLSSRAPANFNDKTTARLKQAVTYFRRALKAMPDLLEARFDLAQALFRLSMRLPAPDAFATLREAREELRQLTSPEVDGKSVPNLAGCVSGALRAFCDTGDAIRLSDEAITCFRMAAEQDPHDRVVSANLAVALVARWVLEAGCESLPVPTEAMDLFEKSLSSEPTSGKTEYLYGGSLLQVASTRSGPDQLPTVQRAFDLFGQAIDKTPSYPWPYKAAAEALALKASLSADDDASYCLDRASELLDAAEELVPGGVSRERGILALCEGDVEACRGHLTEAIQNAPAMTRYALQRGRTFEPIRGEPWFSELLDQAFAGDGKTLYPADGPRSAWLRESSS